MVKSKDFDLAVKGGRFIVGFKQVVRALGEGLLSEVVVSLNGESFIPKLKLVSGSVPISVVELSSKDLGVKCRRPFNIAVLGLLFEGKKVSAKEPVKKKVVKKHVKKIVKSKASSAKPKTTKKRTSIKKVKK